MNEHPARSVQATPKRWRVIVAAADADTVSRLRASLRDSKGASFEAEFTSTLPEAIERVERAERFDAAVLSLSLPDVKPQAIVRRFATGCPQLPVVLLADPEQEDLAASLVAEGAQDYLLKDEISAALVRRILQHAIERERLGKSLLEQEKYFRLITENATDLITVLDREGNRLYVSRSYEPILGDPKKLVGSYSLADVHPEDAPRLKAIFEETVRSGQGVRAEFRLCCRDGSHRHIESLGSAVKDAQGQTSRVVVVSRDITERKLAETALQESEQRYRHLLASVTDYIYTVQVRDGRVVSTAHGPGCQAVTGYTPQEYAADDSLWFRIIPEEDLPSVRAMIDRAVKGERCEPLQHRIIHKDGRVRWVRNTTVSHRNEQGAVVSYDGLVSDVTARRLAIDRLRESEQLYHSLVESLPQSILRKDAEGRFTFVNRRFAELVRCAPKDIIGKTDEDFYPPAMARKFRDDDQTVMRSGKIFETTEENLTANGERRYVNVVKVPIRDRVGHIKGVQCIFWDVTARKRAEDELRKSEKRFQDFMEETPAVVYVKDPEGRYLYVNTKFEQLTQLDRGRIIGKSATDVFPGPHAQAFIQNDEAVLESGHPQTFDEVVPQPDGPHDYLSIKFPIRDPRGQVYAVCGIASDITDRKRSELELQQKNAELARTIEELTSTRQQLFHAEKLKSVGTLAAGVAHEVKNPLQILMLGLSDLAGQDLEADAALTLSEMRSAIERANTIVQGLLDFSRYQALSLQPTCINEIIQSVLRLLHYQLVDAHIRLQTEFDANLPEVSLDRQKMEQVVLNLITNAIHAMPRGGDLSIRTYSKMCAVPDKEAGFLDTTAWRVGERLVVVEIDDSGGGIPPEELSHIFDPFFTTKPTGKGTGLGLTVVQNIIALHGGNIEVQNLPQRGVRVTLSLKSKQSKGHAKKENPGRR